MRPLLTLVMLLGAALPAASAPLGTPAAHKVGFGVHGNLSWGSLPGPAIAGSKALENVYGPGAGGGAHLDVGAAGLGLRLSGDYVRYTVDQAKFRGAYEDVFGGAVSRMSVTGGRLTITSATASAKVPVLPLPVVGPYLSGGVGVAWIDVDEAQTSIAGTPGRIFPASHQDGKTCFSLGAGVDIGLGVSLFAETRYVWVLTEDERSTFVPLLVGLTF